MACGQYTLSYSVDGSSNLDSFAVCTAAACFLSIFCDGCGQWAMGKCLQDVVRKIENVSKGSSDRPTTDVVIADSGAIDVETPFAVAKEAVKE